MNKKAPAPKAAVPPKPAGKGKAPFGSTKAAPFTGKKGK